MKIKRIVISALILTCGFTAVPQTSKKALSAHNKIHSEQLANAKSRMDKNVITNMLRENIAKKEEHTISEESTKMISDLLSEAHRYIGRPYVHGAKGPKAFDCSGFTSYVYRQFGYTISPSSRAQYTEGTNVERNDLRKGDLVFFTSRRSGKNVGHVGIVVSADNESGDFKFIHASVKGVKVSDFEGYYLGRYVGARRIITE
ncbi:NlpC/P60 family protein [Muribaculaceae bacterium Isolate-113 (HZI)]|jgi:cell wall-associated NlpC family hydrolase|uniref:C40 family peptidase n=1 Tax=Barnesiella sp. CU968 TaxID=2780099 RepID=UPI000F47C145|nr:C40 family peptidase [Barnesiella sp. CU968]MBJ2196412.1 C40 family peptidase [Muribaculaceae bacterium]MCI9029479.1 C40 family peptidase [Muribaculaceae bacterium]ROT21022.1 NlpC/P60 family protein [Muribaculaceae bacterium Isolate-113 (HZI)]